MAAGAEIPSASGMVVPAMGMVEVVAVERADEEVAIDGDRERRRRKRQDRRLEGLGIALRVL